MEHWTKPITDGEAVDISGSDHTCGEHTRALWVGGAGNVEVDLVDEAGNANTVTFTGVAAGTLLPIRISRVDQGNTTATDMLALW